MSQGSKNAGGILKGAIKSTGMFMVSLVVIVTSYKRSPSP